MDLERCRDRGRPGEEPLYVDALGDDWPSDRPVPEVSIEFEMQDADAVAAAADELKEKGFALLHEACEEPWGQTVARLLSARSPASRTHPRNTTE